MGTDGDFASECNLKLYSPFIKRGSRMGTDGDFVVAVVVHYHCAWNEAKRSGSAESMCAVYLFAVVVITGGQRQKDKRTALPFRFVPRTVPEVAFKYLSNFSNSPLLI
jgi:hypothetical protein